MHQNKRKEKKQSGTLIADPVKKTCSVKGCCQENTEGKANLKKKIELQPEILQEETAQIEEKTYKLEGSLCASCAKKIEMYLSQSSMVEEVSLDFTSQTLWIRGRDTYALAVYAVEKFEPGVEVLEHRNRQEQKRLSIPNLLILGTALWLLSFLGGNWYYLSILALFLAGYPVMRDGWSRLLSGGGVDEKFLMTLSSLGALFLGEAREGAAVMVLYRFGEFLTERAVEKATKSLSDLVLSERHMARVQGPDQRWIQIDASKVNVGQDIFVQRREILPLDSYVEDTLVEVDTSSFTGESEGVVYKKGEIVPAGSILLSPSSVFKVAKDYEHSALFRMKKLVEKAKHSKSTQEKFLTTFAKWYTPTIIGLAGVMMLSPLLGLLTLRESVHRALTFLVTACPCALILGVPLSYVVGMGALSRVGVLVKGSHFIDAMAKLKQVAFDKTGTLTDNSMKIRDITLINSYKKEEIIALMAIGEKYSSHPIARAFHQEDADDPEEYKEIPGEGIDFSYHGRKYRIRQGRELSSIVLFEGTKEIAIIFLDENVKDHARDSLHKLKEMNLHLALISGDRKEKVEKIASLLSIDECMGSVTPEDKLRFVMDSTHHGAMAFVGDGINDSAVLKGAHVGISMGQMGSDVAIEASDVVIMDDDIRKIPLAIVASRKFMRTMKIILGVALSVKLGLLVLVSLGLASMYIAVIGDVGLSLLCVAIALRNTRLPKL
ncbi:MAG: cation-translocating P-type ATPase [Tissierellia bacterium]|nr:cation-translocating P-type ATPase [Tissierellia bacterium]